MDRKFQIWISCLFDHQIMDFRIVGSGLEAGGGFPLSGLVGWPADQAAERPPPHDLLASWPYRRYLMGLWHVWLPPGAVGARKFGGLCRPMPACGDRLDAPIIRVWSHRCLEAWGFDARMQHWLAGLAGLAGWLQLAGCCWLAAAGWWEVVSHARRSGEVGGFVKGFGHSNG